MKQNTKMLRIAIIDKCRKEDLDLDRPQSEQRYCLYAHKKINGRKTNQKGRLLGRHPTIEAARKQEGAIHARQGDTSMSKFIRLSEVPESAIKSVYDQKWGQGVVKSLGEDFDVDSKSAQFLFFSVWNGIIKMMDRILQQKYKVDTTQFADDPTFLQALSGLAYFVTDDAIKKAVGLKSDSLQKGAGHAEALMSVIGQEADVDQTLKGLAAQAEPLADKAFDQLSGWLAKQQPEQKAATVQGARDVLVAIIRRKEAQEDEDTEEWAEQPREYILRYTYCLVTPESAEEGDCAEHGFVVDGYNIPLEPSNMPSDKDINTVYESLSELVDDLEYDHSWLEWSGSPAGPGDWITSTEEEDYETGESTVYDAHITHGDGSNLSLPEMQYIHDRLGLHGRVEKYQRKLPIEAKIKEAKKLSEKQEELLRKHRGSNAPDLDLNGENDISKNKSKNKDKEPKTKDLSIAITKREATEIMGIERFGKNRVPDLMHKLEDWGNEYKTGKVFWHEGTNQYLLVPGDVTEDEVARSLAPKNKYKEDVAEDVDKNMKQLSYVNLDDLKKLAEGVDVDWNKVDNVYKTRARRQKYDRKRKSDTRCAKGWEGDPRGWDRESKESFWNSVGGSVKSCIREMEGVKSVTDPGAFCAGLADELLGTSWRKGPRKGAMERQAVTPKYADRLVRDWAKTLEPPTRTLEPSTSGHRSIWLYPVVRMDASDEEWIEEAEKEGLYIPATHRNMPGIVSYLQEEMNERLAEELNENTAAGSVGTFKYTKQDGFWGLLYWTPAVWDLLELVRGEQPAVIQNVANTKRKETESMSQVTKKYKGRTYRKATAVEAEQLLKSVERSAAEGENPYVGWKGWPKGWDKDSANRFWNSVGGSVEKCIKKMEGDVDDPGALCAALKDKLSGTEEWRGKRSRKSQPMQQTGNQPRGQCPKGGPIRRRDRSSRAPAMQLTQQLGKQPRETGQRAPAKPETDGKVKRFFEWLRKKSHEASTRGKWGRLSERSARRECGCMDRSRSGFGGRPRSREADQVVELPTGCVAEMIGVEYSKNPVTLFEQKGGKWFVEGVDTKGVVDDNLVATLSSYCESQKTAFAQPRTKIFATPKPNYQERDKAEGYTWVVDDETWSDEVLTSEERRAVRERAEQWLEEHEGPLLDITVRFVHEGEAAGIYEDLPNGNLQILGYSIPVPDAVNDLLDRAWEYVQNTWPTEASVGKKQRPRFRAYKGHLYREALQNAGRHEEVINVDPEWSSMGKFNSYVDEQVYEWSLDGVADDFLGDAETFGYYELFKIPGGILVHEPDGSEWFFYSAILFADNQGFINVAYYDTVEDGVRAWEDVEGEYDRWLREAAVENLHSDVEKILDELGKQDVDAIAVINWLIDNEVIDYYDEFIEVEKEDVVEALQMMQGTTVNRFEGVASSQTELASFETTLGALAREYGVEPAGPEGAPVEIYKDEDGWHIGRPDWTDDDTAAYLDDDWAPATDEQAMELFRALKADNALT